MRKPLNNIILFILLGIYLILRILHSPNFYLPIKVSSNEYNFLFKGNNNPYEIKYSAGNLKNSIRIIDINKEYRCWIWKYNEYSVLPEYNGNCYSDTIVFKKYVEKFYGEDPMLTSNNKMGHYRSKGITVKANCYSNISGVIKANRYLNLYGRINEIGIFNSDKCELKFKFDRTTNSRIIFLKKEEDFYILVLYGINGNILDEGTVIFNNFEKI